MCIYLDCGNAFTVYTCFIMHQIVHVKYVQFIILQLHINKDVMGFFFFFGHICGMWKFLGQGSNQSKSYGNTRCLNHCAEPGIKPAPP